MDIKHLISLNQMQFYFDYFQLCLFSGVLYREMFLNFDRFCQQEIVADLVTKISSGHGGGGGGSSVGLAATATLEALAVNHTDKVAPYAIFTAALLDYLDSLQLAQVRQVTHIPDFMPHMSTKPL